MDGAQSAFVHMLSGSGACLRRPIVLLLVSTAIFGIILIPLSRLGPLCPDGGSCLQQWSKPEYYYSFGSRHQMTNLQVPGPNSPECAWFPDTSRILLVMKTGASEAYAKIPTQLLTNLRCLSDFLIFSDMEQTVAGHQIHDSLNTVLPEVRSENQDFDLYERQKKCRVDQETCNWGSRVTPKGWPLDKYKNIHIAEKAYALRPSHDWYLFVDADTYVVWPTLVEWLARLNPRNKHYLGSVAQLAGHLFAHGGSGYLMSQGMMRAFLGGKSGIANKYDIAAKSTCCGDALLSKALKAETDVSVKNAWPTVNGEQPHTLAYGEKQWCQPIVTMHHIGSQGVSEFAAFEREQNFSSPMRIKDIYHQFLEDELPRIRDDWDNMSDDIYYLNLTTSIPKGWDSRKIKTEGLSELEQKAHWSFDDCHKACRSLLNCLQYRYYRGVCSTSSKIKHGQPKHTEGESGAEEHWMSGWNLEKIEAWVRDHDKCGRVAWPKL